MSYIKKYVHLELSILRECYVVTEAIRAICTVVDL